MKGRRRRGRVGLDTRRAIWQEGEEASEEWHEDLEWKSLVKQLGGGGHVLVVLGG